MKMYLAGKVSKGDAAVGDWRDAVTAMIQTQGITLLTPENPALDESLPWLVVGHDVAQIAAADVVVIDAREKIGAGTAQEMLFAKYFSKPVIAVLPPDSHHRRSDLVINQQQVKEWIHPFIAVASDAVIDDYGQLAGAIEALTADGKPNSLDDLVSKSLETYESWQQGASP